MNTSMPRVLVALVLLAFVAVACAGETGSQWTYAPVTANDTEVELISTAEEGSGEASSGESASSANGDGAAVAGDGRVVDLLADAALRFTDADGNQVPEIAVTPGETIRFRIDNTSDFDHNFYIGTDDELISPNAVTDIGIPTWQSGVQELEWVVPEDISGLKFGCTVPGHYTLMQGVFTLSDEPAAVEEPATEDAPAEEPTADTAEEPAEEPAAAAGGEPRVIDLLADAALRFTDVDGNQVPQIAVTPGETIVFRIDNTANFEHNFYIGPDDELQAPYGETDIGIPTWTSGVQELEWVVPEDVGDIRFACTVPGHYTLMQGDFVISQ
jgi:uncharacterized cupredoxin-like copper-binding protein